MALDALGDAAGATHCLERLVGGRDEEHFASVATGLRGYLARHNLAAHYLQAGRLDEAQAQWLQALAEQPRYRPALFGLADVCVARRDAAGLEAAIERLRDCPNTAVDIDVLRARLESSCGRYGAARALLEEIIHRAPQALSPRVALCDVLLQQGTDWAAAEQALRAVLAIAPNHAVCRKNLDVLLRQRHAEAAR
jgi:tetratricopeptide (TPR) repeat protein